MAVLEHHEPPGSVSRHSEHNRSNAPAMRWTASRVGNPPSEPFHRRLHEDGPADRESLNDAAGSAQRAKASARSSSGASSPSRTTPRQNGSPSFTARAIFVPGGLARLPFELPPVRLDADRVEPLDDARGGVVPDRAVLAGDDLEQELAPERARGVVEPQKLTLLPGLELRRVVGMIEAEALDRVRDRPFLQLGAERSAGFEIERPGAGLLDRPPDPEVVIDRPEQRLTAVLAVEQHAEAWPAGGDLGRGLDGEQLERADAFARRAGVVGDLFELRAMVDRERHDRRRLRPPRRRPVDMVQGLVAARARDEASRASRNWLSSAQVGYSAEHRRRETAKAPQALA